MCSIVIGKIIEVEEGRYLAEAEGMMYYLYSSNIYSIGDCVRSYVFSYDEGEGEDDDSEFYLEDANQPLASIEDWNTQEENQ